MTYHPSPPKIMRSPQRIKRILKKLESLWLEQPDLRLGQLLTNLCLEKTRNQGLNPNPNPNPDQNPTKQPKDVFYLEDEKLEAILNQKLYSKALEK